MQYTSSSPGCRSRVRRAFTLVETIAAMTIIGIISAVTTTVLWTAIQGFSSGSASSQLHDELSMGLERVVHELRNIPKKATSLAPDVASLTPVSITWSTNSSLVLVGTNLMLTESGSAGRLLLPNVSSFTLTAYDESNVQLPASLSGPACDAIRRLSITITATSQGVSDTQRTKVFIRSLAIGI